MQQNRESNKIDIIEKTTVIVGNITSQADFRIDGKVEGTISTAGKVVIGEEGVVSGKIVCMFLVKSHHHITVSNSFLYSIPCHVYWGHHLGTLATTREVNSQMQCVGVHTRYFYSTKWKRPIPTSSTLCFNCLTMGKLPIAKVTRYLSKIAS